MEHNFNVENAVEFGIQEAIIINNLYYWIQKNESNNKHFYDGRYWTYNSAKAFCSLFPYLSQSQITRILKKLEDKDIILKGNYNQNSYDRTNWYAFSDNAISILRKRGFHFANSSNGFNENVEPIPNSNTNSNTNNKEEKEIATALSNTKKDNTASNKPKKQTKEELYQIKFEQPLKDGEVRHHKYDEEIIKAPELDEVQSYFLNTLGSTSNLAEQFYLFYNSTNWKAGATKIINWKSKASLWVNNNKIYEAKNKSSKKIEVNKTKADERYFELNGEQKLF